MVGRPDFRWQGFEPICVRPQYNGKTAEVRLPTAFAPGYCDEDFQYKTFEDFQIFGNDVKFSFGMMISPLLISGLGTKRWLEKYQTLPLSKRDRQKLRNVALDGVLVFV